MFRLSEDHETASRVGTVLVIGAGMAGLAAARALLAKGISVTVLEARERIGGRIWTDRSWGDTPLDLGASWIHGIEGNSVADLARQFNIAFLPTDYYSTPLTFTSDGTTLTTGERAAAHHRFENLLAELNLTREQRDQDVALSGAMDQAVANKNLSQRERQVLRHIIHTEIEQEYATEMSNLSLWYWDEVGEFPGDHVLIPGGYDQLINALADGLDIRLRQIVSRIVYDDAQVEVITDQGVFTADRAIMTLPLGVLQSGAVTFYPDLPRRKLTAIKRLRMGLLNKLYLRFPASFWSKEHDWIEYIGPAPGVWAEFFNYFKYSGTPILIGFNVGAYARALEQLPDEAIVTQAMVVLRTIYGAAIPEPDAWKVTRWASDPFAGGAYVYVPPNADGEDFDALSEPVGERLFFAGEATVWDHYGTVHGAFRSGLLAVRAIIEPEAVMAVASKRSKVYHVSPDCLDAQDIAPENRVQGTLAKKGRRRHLGCPRLPDDRLLR